VKLRELSASITIPAHVAIKEGNDDLVLLVHGYGQTAKDFLEQVQEFFGERSLCAVQAPFPIPIKTGETTLIGYSWYAYDLQTETFQIPMSTAVDFLIQTLTQLDLIKKVRRVVGFSQGGYIAPYFGLKLPGVKQVIGVNSRFKDEDPELMKLRFRLDAINGTEDKLVEAKKAQASHAKFLAAGVTGEFRLLPKTGHKITEPVGKALRELLSASTKGE
jgi:predicted esterase